MKENRLRTDRRVRLALIGLAGSGKTYTAASVFRSKIWKPEESLYIDNHDSTSGLNIPETSKEHPGGVWHVDRYQIDTLYEQAEKIHQHYKSHGTPLFWNIVLDDISEHDLVAMEVLQEDSDSSDPRQDWGEHKVKEANLVRLLSPRMSGANLILIARTGDLPDLSKKIGGKRDRRGNLKDDRPRILRPLVRGGFGSWVLHQPDIAAWQEMVSDRKFILHLRPPPGHGGFFKNRFWHCKSLPARLINPTFDRFSAMMDLVYAEEDEYAIGERKLEELPDVPEVEEDLSGMDEEQDE